MNRFDNPFHDLWLTEILSPTDFVRMFSQEIVKYSENLFGTGNVVVRGRQGSGKSMLLRLLDTSTRVAYEKSTESSPVPPDCKFIAGSANLIRINISAISARLPQELAREEKEWAAATFADFLNYSLALDLLQNISDLGGLQGNDARIRNILPIDLSEEAQQSFCQGLANDDSWYGEFVNCNSLAEVVRNCRGRLKRYRAYFNFNTDSLDTSVEKSKTEIGKPLAILADCLRESGVIPSDCLVYFKIDQHEELFELERETGLGNVFRQVINKALSRRDRRLAYRIGTRHYSWSNQVKIWGSGAHLEYLRDYSVVDIDEIFRRPEDTRIGDIAFRSFANDVFRRRLSVVGFHAIESFENPVEKVFGATPSPTERARAFGKPIGKKKTYPYEWAPGWREVIAGLREEDPLSAKLGEAWLMQRSQVKAGVHRDDSLASAMPWKEPARRWWRKERNEVALMHLASETAQNLSWFGAQHIIGLSGWNILAFMSICRTIWSGWLRRSSSEAIEQVTLPEIDSYEQVVGIYKASKLWVDKLREGQYGESRRKFVRVLGEWFAATLKRDKALSNPGHNGFSLLRSEFEQDSKINRTIRRCRDSGDLIESDHTSKTGSGKRIKWYLNPIFCPYFGLPHIRTKEPIYCNLEMLREKLVTGAQPTGDTTGSNLELFDRQ